MGLYIFPLDCQPKTDEKRHARFPACLLVLSSTAWTRCTFTLTITPDDLILCPNENATLSTQAYDAYPWYRDGTLLFRVILGQG